MDSLKIHTEPLPYDKDIILIATCKQVFWLFLISLNGVYFHLGIALKLKVSKLSRSIRYSTNGTSGSLTILWSKYYL